MLKYHTLQVREQVAFLFRCEDDKICFVTHESMLSILDLKTQKIESNHDLQECFLRIQKKFLMQAMYLRGEQIVYPEFLLDINKKSVDYIRDGYVILKVYEDKMIGRRIISNQLEHNWLGKSTKVQFVQIRISDKQTKVLYELDLQPQRHDTVLEKFLFIQLPKLSCTQIYFKKNEKFSYFSQDSHSENKFLDGYNQNQFIMQRAVPNRLYHLARLTYQMKQIRRIKIHKPYQLQTNGKICIIMSYYETLPDEQSVYALDLIKLRTQLIVSDQLKKTDLTMSDNKKYACFCTKKKVYTIQLFQ